MTSKRNMSCTCSPLSTKTLLVWLSWASTLASAVGTNQEQPPMMEAHTYLEPMEEVALNSHEPQQVILRPRRLSSSSENSHRIKPWLQENFPNPGRGGAAACHATKSYRICDPDGVLSTTALEKVETYLEEKKYIYGDLCRETSDEIHRHPESDQEKHQGLELQMGVALVQKMDLAPFGPPQGSDREDKAAETFARYVHDDWGVGIETDSCGGAGILLFLSIQDRAIYISRGAALETVLIDRRLDQVMENMKDLLRQSQYDDAILQALEDMRKYVEQGPPSLFENSLHLFTTMIFLVLWIGSILGTAVWGMWRDSRQRRDYARVASQLSEIDRARAEAMQGRYHATSCPICLEDFQAPAQEGGLVTEGSDGQPIKLLRCGHCMDETCWAEWINSGRGTITKCPICQQDIGGGHASNAGEAAQQRRQGGMPNNNNNMAVDNPLQREVNDRALQQEEDRIMRQHHRERNFRLARLGYRYPQIIRPNQIQRWTQPTYDGTLVRDPSFVQSNPAVRTAARSSGGGTRSSFGGSSSGGGRGGRW
ncbi:Zinc finger, C3HC4 type (RING finger) [Seminavis robusta]|uniref:Zinc finger, C3HC4 type (RING finger) n=1 Tax=Seminavis robusta TaxID=568900 RepID=A0A9N8ETQ5_9STRA|nr:Zinc finger, C3HC4 type (RING finger) [Seminavis robusta]|eukprot:Sro1794_g297920.1 Zinc finger, C3HC4 type (RING finger) (539) ;mRNA; r:656-2360